MPRAGGSIFKGTTVYQAGGRVGKSQDLGHDGGTVTSSRPVGDGIRVMSAEPRGRGLGRESCLEEQRDLRPKNTPSFKGRPGHLNAQPRN